MKSQFQKSVVVAVLFVNGLVALAQLSDEAIYQKSLNALFTIKTDHGQGSGFIFKDGQTLVTNYHVIANATWAKAIPANNKGIEYEIVGVIAADIELDVAILRIRGTYRTPMNPAVNIARVAQKVIALGSPLGYEASITTGIVSGLRGTDIQHTAAISSGSSGGPLLNEYGNVVGMNTKQIVQGQNLNFAVSLSVIEGVLKNEHGLVTIAEINNSYGTAKTQRATTATTNKTETSTSELAAMYMEFEYGALHQAIMLSTADKMETLVRYYSDSNKRIEVIQESCKIDTDYKNSDGWVKIGCTDPIILKTKQASNYIPDTFWMNTKTNKVLLSDGRRDDKGELIFTNVTHQTLSRDELVRKLNIFLE